MSKKGKVQCELCPRRCILAPGQRGDCRARENIDGDLETLVYGNPCAVHVDPMEKKPLFHFLPGSPVFSVATAGCNLHCRFCQNWEISQRSPEETNNLYLPPDKLVAAAAESNCRSIAYTYSEPIIFYEYMYDSSIRAHRQGMKNVMVTAGYIEEKPLRELCPVIDAANVDLKGDDDYYRDVCLGTLAPVRRTLEIMVKEGVWVEITNLIVPTLNDQPEKIGRLAEWVHDRLGPDLPLHFSRFHPTYKLRNLPPTPVETLKTAREIALGKGLHYVYIGNVPGLEGESTFCPKCGKIVIKRIGYRILENKLKDGNCGFCGQPIAGVWKM